MCVRAKRVSAAPIAVHHLSRKNVFSFSFPPIPRRRSYINDIPLSKEKKEERQIK
jgi:hypothetical protein